MDIAEDLRAQTRPKSPSSNSTYKTNCFFLRKSKPIVATRKSTGPTTPVEKEHSRCNAVRHGLTAETVMSVLESPDDYKAFETAVISDYNAQTAVDRQLALPLASVLWQLRRATSYIDSHF
jgi:hypothetical protein